MLSSTVLRIRDVYPGSRILIFTHPVSRIPDPKTATKERGEKNYVVIPFFVTTNFTKLNIIKFFEIPNKKFLASFQRIIELFTQKIVTMLSKIWVWDPGSRGQIGTGSRIRIRNTGQVRYVRYWTIPTIQYPKILNLSYEISSTLDK
jgi:hypothetical protein